jgi:hypothetical protein
MWRWVVAPGRYFSEFASESWLRSPLEWIGGVADAISLRSYCADGFERVYFDGISWMSAVRGGRIDCYNGVEHQHRLGWHDSPR